MSGLDLLGAAFLALAANRLESSKGHQPHEKVTPAIYHRTVRILKRHQETGYNAKRDHQLEGEARRFSVQKKKDIGYTLYTTHRFGDIAVGISVGSDSLEHFPSFVTFLGETGKNPIISMLLASQRCVKHHSLHSLHLAPGTVGNPVPTTDDVQTYLDLAICASKVPILLPKALEDDCRPAWGGLVQAKSVKGGMQRQYMVAHFPKLLYTFSDVVVFVMREARRMESIAAELFILWAEKTMDKSLPQAGKPHIIIVINPVDIDVEESDWNTDVATNWHLEVLDNTGIWDDSPLGQMAERITAESGPHLDSIGGLLRYFYSSVTMQVGELYRIIEIATAQSHREKSKLGIAVSADRIRPLFTAASHQFANSMDEPFDLLAEAASYKFCLFCACQNSPGHALPCGHVLCATCVETSHDGSADGGLKSRPSRPVLG
ncbi:hypothetical protein B0T18DRAFT_394125 [Schizothecium vesticola]|uniref:RING-type domain-containing protein n=1 Tax=Schizothecium vesticola TaxID=314040 RepID=A0AA40ELH6_9PEZI|nr:hypothetical protein B0T18DRAFT_394125 [Schizothecium vesticola]